mmetsp:Transcript_27013/g.88330  ORF Transcript_27013/g.88330 Transcript_27013/m.88330 type:complete len:216 (+) Transcript_27013:1945-2592(+)
MSPSPHMSLHIILLPEISEVLDSGSFVSIFVVALVRAGKSPSQKFSPIFITFAILTSPCATPQACRHLSAWPTSCTTRTGISSGAPDCHSDRDREARSDDPRSKTVHNKRTARVSPPGFLTSPPPSCPHSTSANSLPRTLRVLSASVMVSFSFSGSTGTSMRCQNHARGVKIFDSVRSSSVPAHTTPPRCPVDLRRSRFLCLRTCFEKACSVGSW